MRYPPYFHMFPIGPKMAQRELAESARNRRFSQVQAVRDRAFATCEAAVERLNWENHGILTAFLGDVTGVLMMVTLWASSTWLAGKSPK